MIYGVVPCSGASRRMGRPKATLQIGGRTFVQAVVDSLLAGGCDEVLVVVAEDEHLQDAAERTGARVLVNPDPGDGPITSLRLALKSLPAEAKGILYLPVDHPLVSPTTVSALLSAARPTSPALVLPMLGDERGHPSYMGRSLFDELLDPALEGGARIVVHRHLDEAILIPVDDAGVRADLDTPQAYADAAGLRTDKLHGPASLGGAS